MSTIVTHRLCEHQTYVPKGTTRLELNRVLNVSSLRKKIMDLEKSMLPYEQLDCKLIHRFPPGLYVREIFIPAGACVVGKIHKHSHLNFISSGKSTVITKDGLETLEGPCTMISTAGTKRALYAHTDLVWTTVHLNPSNTQDLDKLEDEIIAPSYEVLDRFLGDDSTTVQIEDFNKFLKIVTNGE